MNALYALIIFAVFLLPFIGCFFWLKAVDELSDDDFKW
jgi:hypothetical protein